MTEPVFVKTDTCKEVKGEKGSSIPLTPVTKAINKGYLPLFYKPCLITNDTP